MHFHRTLAIAAMVAFGFACGEPSAPAKPISFASISAGYAHTCGISIDGAAYCWGSNNHAQLGGGPRAPLDSYFYPAAISGEVSFTALSGGGLHTCGLDAGGTAYCWGASQYGQVGAKATESCFALPCASSPVPILDVPAFRMIAAGYSHTCALSSTGDIYCWGDNHYGQLGNDSVDATTWTPRQVPRPGTAEFVGLDAGQWHTCGVSSDGQAYCWGLNDWGQVGAAAKDTCLSEDAVSHHPCSRTPVLAASGLTLLAIGAGWGHTCGLTTSGATYCWGYDGSGQLGIEPDSVATECPVQPASKRCGLTPVRVSGDLAFVSLTVGGSHNCGLLATGEAYCWGGHLLGQLGDCSLRDFSSLPRPVCGGHLFAMLSAGSGHTCAIDLNQKAFCWGPNDSGQLGSGSLNAFGPVPVGSPQR